MTNLNFAEVRPDDYTTTPEQRLTSHLFRDLCRQYPDDKETHFRVLAADLAAELTRIAGTYRREDYRLQVRRHPDATSHLEKLSDL